MEVLFLGSGAAEFWPSPFCGCKGCRDAIAARGPGRTGACVMVDETFLFDAPPNWPAAALRLGASLARVQNIFITHSHQDHLDPCTLTAMGHGPQHPLHLHCNRHVADLLPVYAQFNRFFNMEKLGIEVHVLSPFEPVTGEADSAPFELTPLLADHDTTGGEEPLIYIFRQRGKTLLYACDTGWFPDRTWRDIEKHTFDLVMLECTGHVRTESRVGHLSMAPFLEVLDRFRARDLLNPGARCVAHHLNPGHSEESPSHELLVEHFRPHGVDVAYDGLILQV